MKPYPGVVTVYHITGVPLGAVTTASQHVNILINGGTLSSSGTIETSPKVTNVRVRQVTLDSLELTYLHMARTHNAEEKRVTEVGKSIQKQNNRSAVYVDVQSFRIMNSRIDFSNRDSDPPYELFITDANAEIDNLTNRPEKGKSHFDLSGKFMGSGATHVDGTTVASDSGPELSTNIEMTNTRLTSLNPLLRAYGRIDVAQGYLTVYSQINVKNSRIGGYLKPIFADVEVYGREKDKNKNTLQRTKDLLVGAAAHLLKNRSTQKVATEVNLTGDLKSPNLSTWQALVEALRNAFVEAILPGFDHQVSP
jgi:hypothetical protein